MAYPLSPETLEWQRKARAFAEEELIPYEEQAEFNEGVIPIEARARHKRIAQELGFARMDAPKAHGGLALPMLDQVVIWEQLGRVTNALCWCKSRSRSMKCRPCRSNPMRRRRRNGYAKRWMAANQCRSRSLNRWNTACI